MGPVVVSLAEARRLMAEQASTPARRDAPRSDDDLLARQQRARQREGECWQIHVERLLATLASHRRLAWHRTNQPYRIVGQAHQGHVIVFTGDGPPDYYLTTTGGLTIAADAKSTTEPTWWLGQLEDHQARDLDDVEQQGGRGAIFLALLGQGWVIPWAALRPRWWTWYTTPGRAAPGTASLTPADVAALGWEFDAAGAWLDRLSHTENHDGRLQRTEPAQVDPANHRKGV